jgi:outer membrane protein OmpA-like peptidoglycan-associated protein
MRAATRRPAGGDARPAAVPAPAVAPGPAAARAGRPGPRVLGRPLVLACASLLLVAGAQAATAPRALADPPSVPPGSLASPAPPHVDGNAPGLRLRPGATLAPARVLDIVSVVEDQGGDERREDTPDTVTFALQAEVLFTKDSAKLSPDAKGRIAAIADEIKAQGAHTVRVFGFTDNLGSSAHGLVLSKQRAEAVHQLLEQQLSDPDITYDIRGYGEQYPIADNGTEAGREKNRRVEVTFPRSGSSSDTGGQAPGGDGGSGGTGGSDGSAGSGSGSGGGSSDGGGLLGGVLG